MTGYINLNKMIKKNNEKKERERFSVLKPQNWLNGKLRRTTGTSKP